MCFPPVLVVLCYCAMGHPLVTQGQLRPGEHEGVPPCPALSCSLWAGGEGRPVAVGYRRQDSGPLHDLFGPLLAQELLMSAFAEELRADL